MVEVLQLDNVDAQVRLKQVEAGTVAPVTRTTSHWLLQDEMRLDAGFHSDVSMQARQVVEQSSVKAKSLGSLTTSISYPTRFKRIHTQSKSHGVPFLTPSLMLQFRPSSDTYLAKRPSQLDKCTVPVGAVLVTRSGTVGRCVVVGNRLHGFAVSDDAIRVVPDTIPGGYLYAFLMSWVGQALLRKNQYGSAIKHLEPHHLAGIPVPVLAESEMRAVSDGISRAYSLREEANELLDSATDVLYAELGLPEFDETLVEYLPNSPSKPSSSDVRTLRAFATRASNLEERLDAS